jgi:CheY-specific phosphatase CheX
MMQAKEALYSAAITTFEDLAFAVADRAPEGSVTPIWAGEARVAFVGPWDGELVVRLDGAALARLSTNMLGADVPPTPELQRDALAELANVICGHVLPVLAGSDVVFYLDAPALGVACERPGDREGVRVALKLDTGQAEVILHGAGVGAGA